MKEVVEYVVVDDGEPDNESVDGLGGDDEGEHLDVILECVPHDFCFF